MIGLLLRDAWALFLMLGVFVAVWELMPLRVRLAARDERGFFGALVALRRERIVEAERRAARDRFAGQTYDQLVERWGPPPDEIRPCTECGLLEWPACKCRVQREGL